MRYSAATGRQTPPAGRVMPNRFADGGPGGHHDPAFDARFRTRTDIPIRIVERRPETVTASFERHRTAGHFGHGGVLEIRNHRLAGRDLRHRAMVGPVPRRVFRRMTRLSGGPDIAGISDLDCPVDNVWFGHRRRRRREPGHCDHGEGGDADQKASGSRRRENRKVLRIRRARGRTVSFS